MMPGLGGKYEIELDVLSKPIAEYQCDEYFELELPVAPAIMVGEEIVCEGTNVSQDKVEEVICRHLGLPAPELRKKGFLDRLRGK